MENIGNYIQQFADFAWGTPLLILLLGGGFYFLVYSRLVPFRYFRHAIQVIRGKFDNPDEPGHINHFQALATALSGTVGMGNVSGVAVAITVGGPGAIFWMWVSALLGVATKYFTCTLAVMYRGKDSSGVLQGGPMYVIVEGLGKKWKPLAIFFSVFGMIGVLPLFQANQLTQFLREVVLEANGVKTSFTTDLITGIVLMLFVATIVIGGIKRIGKVAGNFVPFMVVVYILSVIYILVSNYQNVPAGFKLIFTEAFNKEPIVGGALGSIIITGVRRAAFSNEAGMGTAPMAHGAVKTNEPIREGLVAMLGPIVDTLIICTMTALSIIVTGVWQSTDFDGITLTASAFDTAIPGFGPYLLIVSVFIFSITTMFAFPYYGEKCFSFIFGTKYAIIYKIFYAFSIIVGATTTLGVVISFIDSAYALMAIPTMVSAILLSPKVIKAGKEYFSKLDSK